MGQEKKQDGQDAPVIILVGTQLGENIGGAARVMLNFGLSELRLVAPRDGWPSDVATAMAAGADKVLENAKLFATTAGAVGDLNRVVAATARRRGLEIPVLGTGQICGTIANWQTSGQKCGILFGPEKAGLVNDDVVLADAILSYPVDRDFPSLNLAQAIGVFAFLWASRNRAPLPDSFNNKASVPARREDIVRMFEHLENELETSGFFHPPEKTGLMKRNIRAPLVRAGMTGQEVRTMRGLVKALAKGRGRPGP